MCHLSGLLAFYSLSNVGLDQIDISTRNHGITPALGHIGVDTWTLHCRIVVRNSRLPCVTGTRVKVSLTCNRQRSAPGDHKVDYSTLSAISDAFFDSSSICNWRVT